MHDGGMTSTVPVITLASIDPLLRGAAAGALLCDLPGSTVLQYDLVPLDDDGGARLHRTVFDTSGVQDTTHVDLDHGCIACAVRADMLPTLELLAAAGAASVVLSLPPAAEPLAVVRGLTDPEAPAARTLRAAAVVAVVDGATLVHDLMGDETLAERGLRHRADDSRALGEVLAHQVEYADVVLTPGGLDARAARLVAHLADPATGIATATVHRAPVHDLLAVHRPADDPRGDPARCRPSGRADGDGVWTVDLVSHRPLHPRRLLDLVEQLGAGPLRARGHFWVPGRPHLCCAWDGAGGQLGIGAVGPWRGPRGTRIVITGCAQDDDPPGGPAPELMREVFGRMLLDDAELARDQAWWAARPDELEPWLGEVADLG